MPRKGRVDGAQRKRGPKCSICSDKRARAINREHAKGVDLAAISRKFAVSDDSLRRHFDKCAPEQAGKALAAIGLRDLAAGIGIVEESADLYDRTLGYLDTAEEAEDLAGCLAAVREARAGLEQVAKLTGKLKDAGTNLNVLVLPETKAHLDRVASAFEACASAGCTRCADAWEARR